ncbi:MAG: hypothetical protein CMH83_19005 [Nocardioides sp.]|nr:hypothetical protein [Nocardioides sp.]
MRVAVTVLLTCLLTACGGSGDPSTSAASPRVSTTSTASSPATADTSEAPAAELLTLRETCPLLEAAAPKGFNPPRKAWARFLEYLWDLEGTVDVETQNVLDMVAPDILPSTVPTDGAEEFLDAFSGITEAFSTLGRRCRAVGSSSFS